MALPTKTISIKDPAWLNNMMSSLAGSTSQNSDLDLPTSFNVVLLVGLVSGLGTLFFSLLIAILWFTANGRRRIRLGLGDPGEFDDEQAFLEREEQALETMDDVSKQDYFMAKAFIAANPPNSVVSDISLSQFLTIQEKGVSAWEFEVDFPNANCFVEGRTEIEFFDSTCCSQTNLPVPRQNDVYYWEAKMYDKPETTLVSVGISTKPYPTFRLPGHHRYSVAYDSFGVRRINQPFYAPPGYGPPFQQGDVVGVGYRPRTGTVFFTRNGKKLDDLVHGYKLNFFPTVGANGPCKVSVNFGQAGFVFIEANVKKWGLAPANGSLAPPPPYGAEQDFLLLASGSSSQQQHPAQNNPFGFYHNQASSSFQHQKNLHFSTPTQSPPPFDHPHTEEAPVSTSEVTNNENSNAGLNTLGSSNTDTNTPNSSNGEAIHNSVPDTNHTHSAPNTSPPSYTSDIESIDNDQETQHDSENDREVDREDDNEDD